MMIDYITGHLGGSQDQAHAASVLRVIVAGNSIEQKVAQDAKAGASSDITQGAQELDLALLQLCAAVPVDIMAGATDPSQFMMPQQPLHRSPLQRGKSTATSMLLLTMPPPRCLFPQSSRLKSLQATTNPYEAVIEGAHLLGSSGQPLDDLDRYTKNEAVDRTQLLANTLEWRHMAPTTPDTLACFPYKSEVRPVRNCVGGA